MSISQRQRGVQDVYLQAASERFSTWLRDRLAEQGMVPNDLVRATGKSKSVVSKWCNGRNLPTPENAVLVADVLKVQYQLVFDLISPMATNQKWTSSDGIDEEIRHYAERFNNLPYPLKDVVKAQLKAVYNIASREEQKRKPRGEVSLSAVRESQEQMLTRDNPFSEPRQATS